MPHSPIVPPGVEQGRVTCRKQERADRGPAKAVEPERAVRFEHMAVRAHPTGLPAAAGEIPLAGQAIASVHRSRARSVWRSPGHDAARISEDGAIDRRLQIGGDQGRTVGDECVPRDRGVVPGELFDRRHVERRLRLVAPRRARQQHAEQPRVMEPPQQRLGDAPRALDLVGRGGNLRPELAGAGDRVRTRLHVHAPPRVGRPLRPNARALSTVSSPNSSCRRLLLASAFRYVANPTCGSTMLSHKSQWLCPRDRPKNIFSGGCPRLPIQ